jgi:hypothetical protein
MTSQAILLAFMSLALAVTAFVISSSSGSSYHEHPRHELMAEPADLLPQVGLIPLDREIDGVVTETEVFDHMPLPLLP